MEAIYKKGKVRAIGVSNFSEKLLEQLLPHCTVTPAVDQVGSVDEYGQVRSLTKKCSLSYTCTILSTSC